MAKVRLGAIAGAVSGSIGTQTWSRNRYGAYVRNRSKPVISTTTYAQAAKARLAQLSQAWDGVPAADRLAWATWAQVNPIVDRLGDSQVLAANAAFQRLNNNLAQAGDPGISIPPVDAAPPGLETLSGTADIGAGAFELVFTPTPLGATSRLVVLAAVVDSGAISYVRNLYKQVTISAANVPSGLDTQAAIETRCGTLQAGQWIHFLVSVHDTASGQRSTPRPLVLQVTDTP